MDLRLQKIVARNTRTNVPEYKTGQTVKIYQKIKDGEKERLQAFEGLIINANQGKGVNGMITVRKVVDGVGVERIFPIHSPTIAKVDIIKEASVRRSRLYYLREKSGKAARLKTTMIGKTYEPKATPAGGQAQGEQKAAPAAAEAVPATA